jgi:hypothetical protein
MTTETSHPAFQPPESTPNYFRPVQVEDATAGLSIIILPNDERALLMWPLGNEVHYTILSSPIAALDDDVVEAPDIQVAVTFGVGDGVHRCAAFTHDGEVYFSVNHYSGSVRGVVDIYKADDPTNPTTWSLHGNVWAGATPAGLGFTADHGLNVGVPYVTAGGRWIMPSHAVYYSSSFGGFWGERVGIWTSDNGGVTWTRRLDYGTGAVATSANWISPRIIRNPDDGKLLCAVTPGSAGGSNAFPAYIIESSNDGTTWANSSITGGQPWMHMLFDNTVDAFVVDGWNGALIKVIDAGVATNIGVDLWDIVAPGQPQSYYDDFGQGIRSYFTFIDGAAFYCVSNYIASATTGWLIGSVALG